MTQATKRKTLAQIEAENKAKAEEEAAKLRPGISVEEARKQEKEAKAKAEEAKGKAELKAAKEAEKAAKKVQLADNPIGIRDGNQVLVARKEDGKVQLWRGKIGFGVVRIVDNKYQVILSCRSPETTARLIYNQTHFKS